MSLLGLSSKTAADGSPLETGVFRAQQTDVELRRITRREWWLWFSTLAVTVLCISALVLSFYKPFFLRAEQHFYDIQPDQARWGTGALLALFNSWMLYRQWFFRRQRRQLNPQSPQASQDENGFSDNPTGMDPVTGMYTRASIEPHLGKEIGRAKRQNTPLSIATLHLDDFDQIAQRYGQAMSDLVLKEFVRRFKRAIRGSDYAVRLGTADFALVLPECSLDQVKNTLSRIGPLEVSASGKKISVTYSTGWVDYQRGNLPGDLIKRATEILHLYDRAAKDSSATLTAVR